MSHFRSTHGFPICDFSVPNLGQPVYTIRLFFPTSGQKPQGFSLFPHLLRTPSGSQSELQTFPSSRFLWNQRRGVQVSLLISRVICVVFYVSSGVNLMISLLLCTVTTHLPWRALCVFGNILSFLVPSLLVVLFMTSASLHGKVVKCLDAMVGWLLSTCG